MECFLTKGIFEAAKTSHQRKQILLGVERKLSVAQSLRCYGIVTKLIGLFFGKTATLQNTQHSRGYGAELFYGEEER